MLPLTLGDALERTDRCISAVRAIHLSATFWQCIAIKVGIDRKNRQGVSLLAVGYGLWAMNGER
ncbi:hypothetical protein FXE65_12500 [Vibrio cholerae]|nr:hypothetical protein [Vibrio cholerae]EGQ9900489.1 hypothetical protein [Vibrio cholerae]EGQ9963950.1 hypothetical protein [Vibrio cholerae]EGR0075624.1 hypothetical protein [Vibrio cholerae]EGR0378862.1 hypothetical protein [Vibrio cholerae]